MKHPKPDLIIFDMGRVLLDFDFKKVVRNLKNHTPKTEKEIRHYFESTPLWDRFERGEVTPEVFFTTLTRDLGLTQLSFTTFEVFWNDIFTPKHDSLQLLSELRGKYRLALLSNVNKMHWDFVVERHDFLAWFDHPVASFAVGHRKPDPAIYHHTLQLAGHITPEKAIFIDDMKENVDAAQALGIRGHHFTTAALLREDLKGLL